MEPARSCETKSLIPVEAITKIGDKVVTVNQTRERVVGAPVYDPSLVDDRYYDSLYGYYGWAPYWGPATFIRRIRTIPETNDGPRTRPTEANLVFASSLSVRAAFQAFAGDYVMGIGVGSDALRRAYDFNATARPHPNLSNRFGDGVGEAITRPTVGPSGTAVAPTTSEVANAAQEPNDSECHACR